VANTLGLYRQGAVGFIDWLDVCPTAHDVTQNDNSNCCEPSDEKHADSGPKQPSLQRRKLSPIQLNRTARVKDPPAFAPNQPGLHEAQRKHADAEKRDKKYHPVL